jgi:peptide/nickel transport system substrate-binding protein
MFKNRLLNTLFIVVVVMTMGLSACQPAPTPIPTPTPAPVAPTIPTSAPTVAKPTQPTAVAAPTKAPEPTVVDLNNTRPLVVAMPNDITNFEPNQINTRTDSSIVEHIFDSLIRMDANAVLQPMLAESWKILDDKKTWQFKLRQGVTFQDGEPFNANTVKYDFERGLDPQYKWTGNTPGYVFTSIGLQSVEVVDDYTVNLKLDRYEPDTPGYISEVFIHPVKYYQGNTLEKVAAVPVGGGPYKLKEWVKDDHITLERWDGYWGAKPPIKTITFRIIPEASTAVAELLAGNVDVVSKVPPDQAATVDKSGIAQMVTITGGRRIYIGFEQKCTGPGCQEVKDVRVRQALNMAVDVQSILDGLFQGKGKREGGMVNPPFKSAAIQPYAYDIEGAKKLLTEAGYPNGFKCDMATPNGRYQGDSEIALAVADQLKKVGVDCAVVPYQWSVYSGMTSTKQLPALYLLGTGSDFLSAWYDLSDLNSLEATTNYVNWTNPEWEQLVKKLGVTYDPAERKTITDRMQMIVHDDAPWLFIYMQVDWYSVNNKVDWKPRPDEVQDFRATKYK